MYKIDELTYFNKKKPSLYPIATWKMQPIRNDFSYYTSTQDLNYCFLIPPCLNLCKEKSVSNCSLLHFHLVQMQ